MWLALGLGFLGGLLGVNSLPHFIKGITHENYPMVFGNAPIRNAIAGFVGLVVSGALLYFADIPAHAGLALIALSVGGLISAIFHGNGGAFGARETSVSPESGRP